MKALRKRCGWCSKHRARQWRGRTPTNGGAFWPDKLLDIGDAKTAYQIVRGAASPANEYYRAEAHFMAGWIALRFLSDPKTAFAHFQHVDDGSTNPIVLARAGYWRGRAAEATGRVEDANANYTAAARYSTAYYGQLARARLGLGDLVLHEPVRAGQVDGNHTAAVEVVRAAELLYSMGERDLAVRFVAALAEQSEDATLLAALAEVTIDHEDPQATLLIGKGALAGGIPLDPYAFSTVGLPPYKPMGPEIDPSIVYACGLRVGLIRGTLRPRTRWDSCRSRRKRAEIPRAGSDFPTIGLALFAIPSTTPKWGQPSSRD
jgi:soluble lytic murein transglycosylase